MSERAKFPSSWGVLEATWEDENLYVKVFNHGNEETLMYSGVPREVFDELQQAESKGGYFNRNIRNTYSYVGKS